MPIQPLTSSGTRPTRMPRSAQIANLIAVVLPFLGTLAAIVFFWNRLVTLPDLLIFLGMYLVTGFSITVGFHRRFTHGSFRTFKPIDYLFAICGSMAAQGSVIVWVTDHRKHHAHADLDGDPHSPHLSHGQGLRGILAGLVHSHFGWLLTHHGIADPRKYAADLCREPGLRLISRLFPLWIALGLAIPASIGYLVSGTLVGAATALLWGGLVRIFFVHHITWSINSVCHFLGTRRFDVEDESTNVFWLALPSLGEAWHHNHHAFPRSASHGLSRWELDPSGWVISAMEKVGLAWDVVRISSERQTARLAVGTGDS